MAYSVAPAGTVGSVGVSIGTGAVTTTGGLLVVTGGGFVSTNTGGVLVTAGSVGATVSFDCPQPCISKAISPMPWTARTKKTAIFTRVRPLFFCSIMEPCGVTGVWLFIFKWRSEERRVGKECRY